MNDNHINYIELKTTNVEETKLFYNAVFNWNFTDYGKEYIAFDNSGLQGGFELTSEKIINGALVVLYHSDLELIQAKVQEFGGKITQEIFAFPGGRRFHFQDHSGNELAVWSDKA